ncbi:hypothetical protein JYB55_14865 [Mycolicibacterium septicum]|nr:hypothetical protein [Mycolicibacterium septicum]
MTEQTASAPPSPKKRGVAFPQLSLEAAVEAIVAMGQHGADHSQDAAAAYLGHSTTNSGAYRVKLAALRDWGLIKRGDRERVILSDLAKDLVMEAPDHAQARSLLLAAFESCRVFEQLYEDSAKNIPQDLGRFRNVVVMRHNVATDQADRFIDCFVDSAGYAGLAKVEGNQVTLLTRDTTFWEDEGQKASELLDHFETATTPKAPVPPLDHVLRETETVTGPAPSAIPVALRQSWPIDGGEIEFVIRTPKALPPSIYALMAQMAEVATKMESLLKPAPIEASVSTPVGDEA